jgi:hypothetical protein
LSKTFPGSFPLLVSAHLFFFGGPLKHLSQNGDSNLLVELTFKRRILSCIEDFLKVFFHPPPPMERESFMRIVERTVSRIVVLSIVKIRM